MLANKDLYQEIQTLESVIEKLDKEGNSYEAGMLKSQVLVLKMLQSIRTNQVLELRHNNVKLVDSKRPRDEEKPTDN